MRERYIALENISLYRFFGIYINDEVRKSAESSFDLRNLEDFELHCERVRGGSSFKTENPFLFLVQLAVAYISMIGWKENIDQRIFNRRFRFNSQISETLKNLLNWQNQKCIRSGNFEYGWTFSLTEAFDEMYSKRIWGHDNSYPYLAQFQFTLDSLCATNDLVKLDGEEDRYKIGPKALKTLADNEVEASRFRSSTKLNRLLVILTAVIASASVFEILLRFYGLS